MQIKHATAIIAAREQLAGVRAKLYVAENLRVAADMAAAAARQDAAQAHAAAAAARKRAAECQGSAQVCEHGAQICTALPTLAHIPDKVMRGCMQPSCMSSASFLKILGLSMRWGETRGWQALAAVILSSVFEVLRSNIWHGPSRTTAAGMNAQHNSRPIQPELWESN